MVSTTVTYPNGVTRFLPPFATPASGQFRLQIENSSPLSLNGQYIGEVHQDWVNTEGIVALTTYELNTL